MQKRMLEKQILSTLGMLALATISFKLSTAGHAGDDGLFTLVFAVNSLHIIGAFLRGGGSIALTLIVLPALLRSEHAAHGRALIADTSLRLSTLAAVALAMVVIPGVYNAGRRIGSWDRLVTTSYGQVLIAKVSLVGVMALLGALNRYRGGPAGQE